MTRDDIVKWAQEAAIMPPDWGATESQWRSLEAFAKLVAEHEREACAELLDEMAAKDKLTNYYTVAALAIRERGAP
jgi:hypothetical protein